MAGRDSWGDARTVIVVGRAQPRPDAVERMAGALTGAAPQIILGWYPCRDAQRLHNRDGNVLQVLGESDGHPDPMTESIRSRIAEGEVMQSVGRGRGVKRGPADPLEVIVLGDSVLPVPVDEFLSDEAVLKPTLVNLMLAEGGIAFENPADAARAYPDLWGSVEAAKNVQGGDKTIHWSVGGALMRAV